MKILNTIWKEVLQIEDIKDSDNFFDLGGDSFSGLKIVLKAKEHGLELSMQDIFEKQTIEELSRSIRENKA